MPGARRDNAGPFPAGHRAPSTGHRERSEHRKLAAQPAVTLEQRASEQGLSSEEARRRLTEAGPNEPAPPHGMASLGQLLLLFLNPLVIILLIASLVSAMV